MVANYSFPTLFARFGRALGHVLNVKVMYQDTHIVYEGYIAGYQYHNGSEMEHLFKPGTEFSLKREPENPFDDNAVALYYNGARIGFIPSDTNVEVAYRLQLGEPLKARIVNIDPQSEPWERVSVEILNDDIDLSQVS